MDLLRELHQAEPTLTRTLIDARLAAAGITDARVVEPAIDLALPGVKLRR